jgi:hypothetical protein
MREKLPKSVETSVVFFKPPHPEKESIMAAEAQGRKPQVQNEPKPPFPAQHLPKPGLESELNPRPRYQAPNYRAAGKLQGKAALITGGDAGIGRAVAVLYAREGADVAITYLPQEQTGVVLPEMGGKTTAG